MTTTDTTTMVPLHPFNDDLNFLPDQVLMTKEDTTFAVDMTNNFKRNALASPPSSALSSSSSSSSSFSSNSSTRASRLSLPTLWSNNTATSDNSLTMDSSGLSSNSSLGGGSIFTQLGTRRSSLSHTPLSTMDQSLTHQQVDGINQSQNYSYSGWGESISPKYQQSKHPLRNIWCTPSVDPQQQQSHQRRMSLSDFTTSNCWSPLVSDTHRDIESDMNQIGGYGRRHSVAGPLMNKPLISSSRNNLHGRKKDSDCGRQPYHELSNDYPMKAIDEDDPSLYFSTCYSRQQQHFLNRGVLEHIDEYFGGRNGHGKNGKPNLHSLPPGKPYSPDGYMDNGYQNGLFSYTTPSNGTLPTTTLSTAYYTNNNSNFSKTMTAGGDAAIFGCATVLMGKGIPLHHFLDSNTPLYIVEFKTGRTETCYIMQGDQIVPLVGDLVVVEADRGRDLGKVIRVSTANDIIRNQDQQHHDGYKADGVSTDIQGSPTEGNTDTSSSGTTGDNIFTGTLPLMTSTGELLTKQDAADDKEYNETAGSQKCHVKRLYRLASPDEKLSLSTKLLDEKMALMVCQAKIKQKELPMQVVDAEYQWDRRKLTFYFLAEQRIDFRELVRELFKTYKTRIWMCATKPNATGGFYENQ